MAKRGRAAIAVCSTAFVTLGRAQAAALSWPDLPIAVIPHPFGNRTPGEIRTIADACARDIVALACGESGVER